MLYAFKDKNYIYQNKIRIKRVEDVAEITVDTFCRDILSFTIYIFIFFTPEQRKNQIISFLLSFSPRISHKPTRSPESFPFPPFSQKMFKWKSSRKIHPKKRKLTLPFQHSVNKSNNHIKHNIQKAFIISEKTKITITIWKRKVEKTK